MKPFVNSIPVWGAAIILIMMVVGVVFVPFYVPGFKESDAFVIWILCIGICQIILIAGLCVVAFFMMMNWWKYIMNRQLQDEKKEDNNLRHQQLNTDMANRKHYELERDHVNDLLRLTELAKNKSEQSELKENKEKADQPFIRIISKSEDLDMEKLKELIKQYNHILQAQNSERHA
jgi:hypothetical protein